MIELSRVFGVMSSVPTYTYVDRQGLDGQFKHLLGADRHIVIYGASKQGKTSLRRKELPEAECLVVPCKPEFTLENLYMEVRRQLGKRDPVTEKLTSKVSGAVKVQGAGEIGIPLMAKEQLSGNLEGNLERAGETTFMLVPDGDSLVSLAADIKASGKRVVIEDFHYLAEEQRQRLAFHLKAFWDYQVFFIIIGVWAEQNLLTVYNNDLSGRVEEIDVQWSDSDINAVLGKGEEALNFIFGDTIRSSLVKDANGNVGLLQRMAERVCYNSRVLSRQDNPVLLEDLSAIDQYREQICVGQQTRYHSFVQLIGKGFKDPERTKLKMYHHLVRVCFESEDRQLLEGLDRQKILSRIQNYEANANMTVL